jgi:hypothetical protein
MSTQPLPLAASPLPAASFLISDGDPGTAQTVALMYQLVDQGAKDPYINALALSIIKAANPRPYDFNAQRRALFAWVQKNIRFVRDIAGVETLRTARETAMRGAGDCDCMTVLICALLKTTGNPIRITTIQTHADDPDFSHVFGEVYDGRRWIVVDPARPDARYARGPEHYIRRFSWPNPYEPQQLGLAGYGLGQSARELHQSYRAVQPIRLSGLQALAQSRVRRRRAGIGFLGDDIDWSGIAQAVTAGAQGASNIILASRAANQNIFPSTISPLTTPVVSPVGVSTAVAPAGYVNFFGTLIPTSTLLLGAAVLGGILLLRR